MAEELLDEVRLPIGEACTRAVALHRQYGLADLVHVEMSDGEPYTVRVIDRAPDRDRVAAGALPDPWTCAKRRLGSTERADHRDGGMGFALLAGFVEDLQVAPRPDGLGTEVRMVWPTE